MLHASPPSWVLSRQLPAAMRNTVVHAFVFALCVKISIRDLSCCMQGVSDPAPKLFAPTKFTLTKEAVMVAVGLFLLFVCPSV